MQYYNVNQKDESFRITKTNMGYQLSDFETKEMIGHNQKALETYIASFRKLYAESFVTGTLNTDSLIKTQPLFELTVTTIDNQSTAIKVFNKKAEKQYMLMEILPCKIRKECLPLSIMKIGW